MAEDGDDMVANFMGITGADEGQAIQMLEAAGFSLEEAVNLFFAAGGDIGGAASGAGTQPFKNRPLVPSDLDEDEVRAPLPTKVERLYGDDHFDHRALAAMAARHHHGLSGAPLPPRGTVDVFRDFKAETAAAEAAAAAGVAAPAAQQPAGLSGLFALPADLQYQGTADMAKAQAAAEGRWLLLNVQSPSEFASHRLNRDTWAHEALKEVLKGTFVFYQTYDNTPDGRSILSAYRLAGTPLPVVLVVDPITGAQLWQRAGFMDAEKLMEELVPFMDHGPMDAGAAGLAQANMKRRTNAAAASAAGKRKNAPLLTEDDELQMAIALSMGQSADAEGADAMQGEEPGFVGLEEINEEAMWEMLRMADEQAAAIGAEGGATAAMRAVVMPRSEEGGGAAGPSTSAAAAKTPEEVAAEALAAVPPEPAEGDPDAVRVALRLPGGARLARRFRRGEVVQVLADFAVGHVPEAAAGRRFAISHATPGGAELADMGQTLEAAGVAGAMLAVKLLD